MQKKNTPKNFIEWFGYTTSPNYSRHFWLGIIIGCILLLFVGSALLIASAHLLDALAGGKGIDETTRSEAALNYLVIIGGILGAPFVVWRLNVNQKLADIAEQGLITDRLNKAVEQLGAEKTVGLRGSETTAPNLTVRIGAIYTLERLSQDSARDHIMVMEILSAYIRNASEKCTIQLNLDDHSDVQAALSVIGRRSKERIEFERNSLKNGTQNPYKVNLKDIKIRGADFKNARLSHVDFTQATLHYADFDGAQLDHTDFSFADLTDSTFNGARLSNAKEPARNETSSSTFDLTNVHNCQFHMCNSFSESCISGMYGSKETKLPSGMTRPTKWDNTTRSDLFRCEAIESRFTNGD